MPRLSEVFCKLNITLPNCYLAAELPSTGFSSAYVARTKTHAGEQNILVHNEIAEILIQQSALSPSMLTPVPVMDAFPAGYDILDTEHQHPPAEAIRAGLLRDYETLKSSNRPMRTISEKEALKLLRKAKKDRKEDFEKGLSKAKVDEAKPTAYAPLAPYYLIANGGYLPDEYKLLPYAKAVEENISFHKRMQTEELLDEQPEGVVIAACPDGDTILRCSNGTVVRFSHETPEVIEQWPSLPQFIADSIQDCEA